jgi:hypothetical protein
MKVLNPIVAAAVVGALSVAFAGTVFFLIEQKRPILRRQTEEDKDRFSSIYRRMALCVWLTTSLLYIILTYWWPG